MFRLATFGGLSLTNGLEPDVAIPRRRLAILALLATAGDRGLPRDKLVAYLWPDSSSDDARHSLEQLLYSVRRQLGPGVFAGTDPLRLNTDIVSSDVAAFEAALTRDADAEAVAVYHGPFLDGFYLKDAEEFGRWVEDERARFSAAYAAALGRLAADAARQGQWPAAISAWRSLVALDRLSARSAFGLVRALATAGDGPEALRTAAAYESLVRHELGMPLDPAFASFVQSLRNGDAGAPAVSSVDRPSSGEDAEATRQDAASHPPTSQPPTSEPPRLDGGAVSAALTPFRHSRFVGSMLWLGIPLMLVGIGITALVRTRASESRPPGRQVVAVTVLENRTGDSTLDQIGIMTADYTRIALDKTGMLDVVGPAFDLWQPGNAHPSSRPNPATVRKQTGATIIVLGAYYKEGDSLLFAGTGIDAKSGRLIFSFDSVKASITDRLQASELVRQHVISAIATHVDPRLTPWAGSEGKPPIRFDAYQRFADGMTSFVSGIAAQGTNAQPEIHFDSARVNLERAFRLDTTYYVAALWWFWSRYNVGDRAGADSVLSILRPRRGAMSAYEQALYDYNDALMHGTPQKRFELDGILVSSARASEFLFCLARDALESGNPREAMKVLSTLDDSYSWVRLMRPPLGFRVRALVEQEDYAGAATLAQRIHKDAPDDVTSVYPEIDALAALGRLDELERVVERATGGARANDPNSPNVMLYAGLRLQGTGRQAHAQRLFAQALAASSNGAASDNPSDNVVFGRARSHYYLEHWNEARAAFEQLVTAGGSSHYDRRALVFLGSLAARRGDTAEVSRIRHRLDAPVVNPATLEYFEARVAAVRGQQQRALTFLGRAVSHGAQAEEFVMEGDAAPSMELDFAGLRSSPAFRAVVGRW